MGKAASQQRIDELSRQVAELRQLVVKLKSENARLRAELAALRGEEEPAGEEEDQPDPVAAGGRKAAPRWMKPNVVVVARSRVRRRREPVPGWRRQEPDRQVLHAVEACAGCGSALRRGEVVRRRQVVVLPPVRAEVVEHVVLNRRCQQCGMVNRGEMPNLSEEAGPHRRLSWAIVAQVAVLRTKLRLPLASLQWLLKQVWGLRISEGALCAALEAAARAGREVYGGLLAEARASPVLHVDETGWRQDGRNGFLWSLSTPRVSYFHSSQSRAGYVARRWVGEEYEGVVVSDFYTAYDQLDGLHQRCWAHLLRAIHEAKMHHPDDGGLGAWSAGGYALYKRAETWASQPGGRSPGERQAAQRAFEAELLALCQGTSQQARQTTLCNRIMGYLPELFMFVANPVVPATNNAAERALRPLVVARKISGGTRSAQGSKTRMILQSLIATWDLRDEDPMANMLSLLRSHQTPSSRLA